MAKHANAKLIIELAAKNMSRREIARTRHISEHTIRDVLNRAQERGVRWEDVSLRSNEEIVALLFPDEQAAVEAICSPDYDHVHSELRKPGVTHKLLWQEHADECQQGDKVAVSYTTFTRGYSDHVVRKNITNHLTHKPGQTLEVDWSGPTMALVDPLTAEITKVYLFVAVLPYSQYTYVEATLDMRQNTWLLCHVHAFEFFGGTTVRIVCDNLKTGVIKHPKDGEVILNEAYESLARHYVCAIMPTGVAKPKQKASVEGGVGKIATAIIAKLRNQVFTSLEELNCAIKEKLADYNQAPFQKREGNRKEVFEAAERPFLTKLPDQPFEICDWVYGRVVNLDFHVVYDTNRYSVPYQLLGKKVDLRITSTLVEAYLNGERVASHKRLPDYMRFQPQTDDSHMPPEFAKPKWDDVRMRRWAATIGPATARVVDIAFENVDIKEQAYSRVMAILNLSKRYDTQSLEDACAYCLKRSIHPGSRFLRSVLSSGVAKAQAHESRSMPAKEQGGFVRGASYYAGGEQR